MVFIRQPRFSHKRPCAKMPNMSPYTENEQTIARYRKGFVILFCFLAFFSLMEITLPDVAECEGVDSFVCGLAGIWESFTDFFYPVVLVFSAGVAVWILKRTTFSKDLPD